MLNYNKEEKKLINESRRYRDEQKNLINTSEISGLDELMANTNIPHKIDVGKLLPTKFQPKTKAHFILMIEGVDSFLVSHINEMPEFKKNNWYNRECLLSTDLKCAGELKVTFYSAISPSTVQQIAELLRTNKKIKIVLKQLDPTDTVVAQQTFKKCKLDGFRISNHSYDSNQLEKVLATFKCKTVSIDL